MRYHQGFSNGSAGILSRFLPKYGSATSPLRARAASTVVGTKVGVHSELSKPTVATSAPAAATAVAGAILQPSPSRTVVSAAGSGAVVQEGADSKAERRLATVSTSRPWNAVRFIVISSPGNQFSGSSIE